MNSKHRFLVILLLVIPYIGMTQDSIRRLTFILSIDNVIVNQSQIHDTYFELKTKGKQERELIPFDFTVGSLLLKNGDYDKLFSLQSSDSLFIHIKFINGFKEYQKDIEYKEQIPINWINEQYIVFMVYNYYNIESRQKYVLKKDGYGIEIKVPGAGTVIPKWKNRN